MKTALPERTYGYRDPSLVPNANDPWTWKRGLSLVLALLLIVGVWFALDAKLLMGASWMSDTYDNTDWRTNEGNLHTFGAWDLEAHIWKTEYIMENFPNIHWNPYWYMGMPLFKYYQLGFYALHWGVIALTGLPAARAALLLVVVAHLLATLLTFALCYAVSRRVWVSALVATLLLSNSFITLRSYGWEPITVVFLFLYPLGLLLFLREPLRPLRFWLILVLGISYLCHPLLWFSLCMTMGLYLFSIGVREGSDARAKYGHYIWHYVVLVLLSILIGAVQFFPQISYEQVTSGAHMGVTYLPFYQVPFNIITFGDFLFDMGNLKGPGPIIMMAIFLLIAFAWLDRRKKWSQRRFFGHSMVRHELIAGFTFVLLMMVAFYYLELYDLFPMNLLRSIQYHRIIPEFVITAAVVIASLSHLADTTRKKAVYYSMVFAFMVASVLVLYNIQEHWQTSDDISSRPEFITDRFDGRMSMPYTDQSLAVRNSFTLQPQTYGYYEQGITNPYDDEIFSVSSGYHNKDLTITYLKAANVARLYVNMEEGKRDEIVRTRLNGSMPLINATSRYSYFAVPLVHPEMAQAIDLNEADKVQKLAPGCREIFQETYCGSEREEFVSTDSQEIAYLEAYDALMERDPPAGVDMEMVNPDHYVIRVSNATKDVGVVMKMTYDKDFVATIEGTQVPIEPIGPYYMLIRPGRGGEYAISLQYEVSSPVVIGAYVSILTLISLTIVFLYLSISGLPLAQPRWLRFQRGDIE